MKPTTILRFACLALLVSFFSRTNSAQTLAPAAEGLAVHWTNNLLTISRPGLPGGPLQIWYLEAFCRSGSTRRTWDKTTLPHKTRLVTASPDGRFLRLESHVEPNVAVLHQIQAGADEIDFTVTFHNKGSAYADVDWFQPCIRVSGFTGRDQTNYLSSCFVFTEHGLTPLDKTRRSEEAIYRGGQVYVPRGISLEDVNPRPISPETPVNGLIGCVSPDGKYLLATAWDHTQELFQGVIVCIHNDPRVAGLKPGETKKLHGKVYILKNDPAALLARYHRDFPAAR